MVSGSSGSLVMGIVLLNKLLFYPHDLLLNCIEQVIITIQLRYFNSEGLSCMKPGVTRPSDKQLMVSKLFLKTHV